MRKKKICKILFDMGDYANICKDMSENKDISPIDPLWDKNPDRHIVRIEKGHDFCYVSIEETRTVIVFNPSDDIDDWKSNGNWPKNDLDIHRDFYDSAKKFFGELGEILDHNKDKDIYFTGYSRGGGLTLITAYHFAKNCNIASEVYPIVDPRVGGKKFRKECKRLPIHIHHLHQRGGIVDDVPPRIFGFKDIGIISYLKPKWWYFMPSLAIRWTAIHLDWYDNLQRHLPR